MRVGPAALRAGPAAFRPLRLLRVMPHMMRASLIQTKSLRELPRLLSQIDGWVNEFLQLDRDGMSDRELLDILKIWIPRAFHTLDVYATVSGSSMASFGFLKGILRRWCGEEISAQDLITGLTGIESAAIAPELHLMAGALERLELDGVAGHRRAAAEARWNST